MSGQVPPVAGFALRLGVIASSFAAACTDTPSGTTIEFVAMEVSPEVAVLRPGQSQAFEAVVRDRQGRVVEATVEWQADGGTIDDQGVYTAGPVVGDYGVVAWRENLSAAAVVTIAESEPPPPTDVVMLGAWGCSQVTHEWNAFTRHAAPFSVWMGFNWGGADLKDWHEDLAIGRHWPEFSRLLSENPVTSDVYAEICVRDDDGLEEAEHREIADAVFREMRQRAGPGVRIWVTGMADWQEESCSTAGPEGAEIAARMADHVASLGLASRGPTLTPWKPDELESDRCHPNDQGEDRAALEIVDFFTD